MSASRGVLTRSDTLAAAGAGLAGAALFLAVLTAVTVTDFDKIGVSRGLGFTSLLAMSLAALGFVDTLRAALRADVSEADLQKHLNGGADWLAVGAIFFVLIVAERAMRPVLDEHFLDFAWHNVAPVPWAEKAELRLAQHTPILWLCGLAVSLAFVWTWGRDRTAWLWRLIFANPLVLLIVLALTGTCALWVSGWDGIVP